MEQKAEEAIRRLGSERGLAVVDVQAALGKDPRYYADFSHFTTRERHGRPSARRRDRVAGATRAASCELI